MKKITVTLGLLVSLNSHATMLVQAVKKENVLEVKTLVTLGAKVDKKDKEVKTPLIAAAEIGNVKIANILLDAGATVDLSDNYQATPLAFAVAKNHVDMVTTLLDAKANPNLADGAGNSPLFLACAVPSTEIAKILLSFGANVNQANFLKMTPIMMAALKKSEIFNLLLAKGADVNARDKEQKSVLVYAADSDEFKTTLLTKGATAYRIDEMNFLWDIKFSDANKKAFNNFRNGQKESHLIMAIKNEETIAVKPILSMGINANAQDNHGKTALHWATELNNLDAVLDLIDAKVKLKMVDEDGVTALEYALIDGHVEIAAVLAIAILNEELE